MPSILAIDTSTNRASVALEVDGQLVLEESFVSERGHTSLLFPVLERMLKAAPSIDLIAVGLGPGSYAGIRIGISAATGLGLARKCQLVGIPSIAAFESVEQCYLAIGDARRETFYFSRITNGLCNEGPMLLEEPELRAKLNEAPGLPVFSSSEMPGAVVKFPEARILAKLAMLPEYASSEPGLLEPLYLREAHITMPKK